MRILQVSAEALANHNAVAAGFAGTRLELDTSLKIHLGADRKSAETIREQYDEKHFRVAAAAAVATAAAASAVAAIAPVAAVGAFAVAAATRPRMRYMELKDHHAGEAEAPAHSSHFDRVSALLQKKLPQLLSDEQQKNVASFIDAAAYLRGVDSVLVACELLSAFAHAKVVIFYESDSGALALLRKPTEASAWTQVHEAGCKRAVETIVRSSGSEVADPRGLTLEILGSGSDHASVSGRDWGGFIFHTTLAHTVFHVLLAAAARRTNVKTNCFILRSTAVSTDGFFRGFFQKEIGHTLFPG